MMSKRSEKGPSLEPPRDLRDSSPQERSELARGFYEVVGPKILSLGFRYYPGDRDKAEELVSETFSRVLVALPHFQGTASYQTWIFSIAMRVIVDWGRREIQTRKAYNKLQRKTDLEDFQPSETDVAIRQEQSRQIRTAMATLGRDHRMVLSLIAIDGLSHREAAELLGVAEGTLWSRYARARLALAEAVKRQGS